MLMPVTVAEIAYTAGIIDGEGSVGLNQYSSERAAQMVPRVVVHNTDLVLLEWLKERFGGIVGAQKRRVNLTSYRWQLSSRQAAALLTTCLPYLIVKRREAELTLQFYNYTGIPGHRIPDEERQRRIDLMMTIRAFRHSRYETRGDKVVTMKFAANA